MEKEIEISDDDLWGLGESSLILMENEIEELLKRNDSDSECGIV